MAQEGKGDPITSPWLLQFSDATGIIDVEVEFDGSMYGWPLTGITVTRPEGCDLGVLSLNGYNKFPCMYGVTVISQEQLRAVGLVLFDDIGSYSVERV